MRLRALADPERETVDGSSQGVPLAYLQDLCRYWTGIDLAALCLNRSTNTDQSPATADSNISSGGRAVRSP